MSQNSSSDAISFTQSYDKKTENPLCHCSRPMTMSKSWTDDNPGRRFFKCDAHGFFVWADKEKPYGWQKLSLLEAREQIRRQKEEIKMLKESLTSVKQQTRIGGDRDSILQSGVGNKFAEERNKLENEVMKLLDRKNLLRQFIVLSWGGFIVVTAVIVTVMKK